MSTFMPHLDAPSSTTSNNKRKYSFDSTIEYETISNTSPASFISGILSKFIPKKFKASPPSTEFAFASRASFAPLSSDATALCDAPFNTIEERSNFNAAAASSYLARRDSHDNPFNRNEQNTASPYRTHSVKSFCQSCGHPATEDTLDKISLHKYSQNRNDEVMSYTNSRCDLSQDVEEEVKNTLAESVYQAVIDVSISSSPIKIINEAHLGGNVIEDIADTEGEEDETSGDEEEEDEESGNEVESSGNEEDSGDEEDSGNDEGSGDEEVSGDEEGSGDGEEVALSKAESVETDKQNSKKQPSTMSYVGSGDGLENVVSRKSCLVEVHQSNNEPQDGVFNLLKQNVETVTELRSETQLKVLDDSVINWGNSPSRIPSSVSEISITPSKDTTNFTANSLWYSHRMEIIKRLRKLNTIWPIRNYKWHTSRVLTAIDLGTLLPYKVIFDSEDDKSVDASDMEIICKELDGLYEMQN